MRPVFIVEIQFLNFLNELLYVWMVILNIYFGKNWQVVYFYVSLYVYFIVSFIMLVTHGKIGDYPNIVESV